MVKLIKDYRFFVAVFLIILLGSLAYFNSLQNGFVYDDELIIVENPFLRSLGNIKYLFSKDYFSGSGEFTYRPVLTLTYLLDYHFWKTNAFGYHLTNVIIHILNAILLYLLLIYLLPRYIKKEFIFSAALLSGVFFCLHPIQTEVVNGVAFRDDALFCVFFLLSLIFYLKNKLSSSKKFFYLFSLVCYFLALLSKEMALVLFFFILLIDFYDLRKFYLFSIIGCLALIIFGHKVSVLLFFPAFIYGLFKSKEIFKKLIFYGGYIIATGIYGYIFLFGMVNPNPLLRHQPVTLPPTLQAYLLSVIERLAAYIKLLFFPVNLSIEYTTAQFHSFLQPQVLFSLLFLILVFTLTILSIRRERIYSFSWLWVLFPLGLVIAARFQPISERQLYFSCAGFCIFLGVLIAKAFSFNIPKPVKITIQTVAILIIVSFYFWRTTTRNTVWKDALVFWETRINQGPATERAHSSLGDAYFHRKLYDKAEQQYKKAIEITPNYSYAYYNLGNIYMERRLDDKAIEQYKKVLELDPFSVKAMNNLGIIYSKKGQLSQAQKQYKQIIKINPFNVEAYVNLGNIYSENKLFSEAVSAFKKALELNPNLIHAQYNLGNIYLNQGLYDKAIEQYSKVIELSPDTLEAYNNLGVIYFKLGSNIEAKRYWRKALEINPNFSPARDNLSALEEVKKN